MGGLLRMVGLLVVLLALATGAFAFWSKKDRVIEVLDSLGGVEGMMDSANRFAEHVAPMRDFVNQVAQLKKF